MTDKADRGRIIWRSRRGMRELDLLLLPFAREIFPKLGPAGQAAYKRLLQEDDQTLLLLIQGRQDTDAAKEPAADEELADIAARIRDFSKKSRPET